MSFACWDDAVAHLCVMIITVNHMLSSGSPVCLQRREEQKLSDGGSDDRIHQQQAAGPASERDPVPAAQTRPNPAAHGEVRAQRSGDSERSVIIQNSSALVFFCGAQ